MDKARLCPCGGKDKEQRTLFSGCCEPFITRQSTPDHCEQLMRSRFSAYATGAVDYLLGTWHPSVQSQLSRDELVVSVEGTEWLRLDVLRSEQKGARGVVEFNAYYRDREGRRDEVQCLHEISRFEKVGEQWFYVDGEHTQSSRVKIGRNDMCLCGSGRKFKKCCA